MNENRRVLGDQCTLMFARARLDNTMSIVMNYKTMKIGELRQNWYMYVFITCIDNSSLCDSHLWIDL